MSDYFKPEDANKRGVRKRKKPRKVNPTSSNDPKYIKSVPPKHRPGFVTK